MFNGKSGKKNFSWGSLQEKMAGFQIAQLFNTAGVSEIV